MLSHQSNAWLRQQDGQMAFAMVFLVLLGFLLMALSVDAGLWYAGHRNAQNQSEAAVLAAVHTLARTPGDSTAARDAASQWLTANGADDCSPPNTCELLAPGALGTERYRVSVRRDMQGVFASLSGVVSVRVSAGATAVVGPVDSSHQVLAQPTMPFAIAAQDPDCDTTGETCSGALSMCAGAAFEACPWGIDPDALFVFDETPAGIAGVVEACGTGVTNHLDCVDGVGIDENGFVSGSPIAVAVADPATVMGGTIAALEARSGFAESPIGTCDEPTAAAARARYRSDVACRHRVVLIPIVRLPGGADFGDTLSGPPELLGVATFGIAAWDRSGASEELWGYLMGPDAAEVHPPGYRLQRIAPSSEPNPLAPKLIALVN